MKLYVYVCQSCKHTWYSEDLIDAARCPKCWDWAGQVSGPIIVTKEVP